MSSLFDEMMEEICEKNQKISDLEAKLAESEEEKQDFLIKYKYWRTECEKFKQQLAESKNDYLLLEEQLENANEWSKDFQKENEQLKQQLAEKVKEKFISENWDLYDTADLLEQVCELRNNQIKFLDNQINVLRNNKDGIH